MDKGYIRAEMYDDNGRLMAVYSRPLEDAKKLLTNSDFQTDLLECITQDGEVSLTCASAP